MGGSFWGSLGSYFVAVTLGVVAGLAASVAEPVNRWWQRLGRKHEDPVSVYVITDAELTWQGVNHWISARGWVPEGAPEPPPGLLAGPLGTWVRQQGGWPATAAMVELVIQSKSPVVVDLRPRKAHAKRLPLPPGRLVDFRAMGGAAVEPSTVEVHLDPGEPQFHYFEEGAIQGAMRWTLGPGESQTIIVQVLPQEPGLWAWWLEFTLLTDGRTRPVAVGSEDDPFYVAFPPDDPDAYLYRRNAF